MKFTMSQKKQLVFLVILFVFGVAGLASFSTKMISNNFADGKTIWEWFLMPDFIVIGSVFVAITIYSYIHVNKKISLLVNEAMESLASGVLHFDEKGVLKNFNPAAALLLPDLCEEEGSEHFIGTYKKFLSFVYDHSLDIQDQSRLAMDFPHAENKSRLLFREIIEISKRRIVLVQFYQRPAGDIVATLTDISMMKRHIDEVASLTEENGIMIKAIESGGSGMMICEVRNSSSPVIFNNETWASMLKMSSAEIKDFSMMELFENKFEEQIDAIKEGIIVAKREGYADRIWVRPRTEKKEILWFALYLIFFADANGKEFFVCFLSDQTQARLEQAKVFQSQKLEAVAQLAGGIAHDFNNVLSVIDGYSKLMQRGLDRGDNVSAFFENIHRSVKRGSQITSRLLTFGQCRVTQKINMDVCEQVRDIEAFLMPMMNHSINMILSIQDDACYINSSPDAITQIVMALASNARDSMPQGGDLIVSVAEASRAQILAFQQTVQPGQSYVCIQVIDSGTGIDPEILSRIYEPFFTTKDPAQNSGLGLSLVYGLVKEIDGIIDVKSTLGVGTSLSILVPIVAAPSQTLHIEEDVEQITDERKRGILSGKTVLIVEDSPDVQQMESDLLTQGGLDVLRAGNAHEAFAIHESYKGKIDFLLIDVTLPEMNGVQISKVFADKRPETTIILVSAYPALASSSQNESFKEFLKDKTVLAKPLVYENLEDVMVQSVSSNSSIKLKENEHWAYHEKVL